MKDRDVKVVVKTLLHHLECMMTTLKDVDEEIKEEKIEPLKLTHREKLTVDEGGAIWFHIFGIKRNVWLKEMKFLK